MTGVSQPSVHRRVVASTAIVMGGILLSRVLGLFREWTVAHTMGSNAATDAYYAAFTLPDFLNYLIAGGSLSATFIPEVPQASSGRSGLLSHTSQPWTRKRASAMS